MNHVSFSPTNGNGPTQGQRKTLYRVGIEPTTAVLPTELQGQTGTGCFLWKSSSFSIDESTLLSASWVIRARWREIQRFVWSSKRRKVFMICNFVLFNFPKQKICAQRCGRIKLERLL